MSLYVKTVVSKLCRDVLETVDTNIDENLMSLIFNER